MRTRNTGTVPEVDGPLISRCGRRSWQDARSFATLGLFLALSACVAGREAPGDPAQPSAFTNPYAGIGWDGISYHDANLHTHSTLSDGHHDPHHAIDTYHALGYDILALTDHDIHHVEVWPRALYPWTELNDIFHLVKDEIHPRHGKTYGEVALEEWQNRDPDELGMVSIPGSEISHTDHLGSLFNHYAGGTDSEEVAFAEIGRRDGLAVFNHPGRYDRSREWYLDYFRRHPHVVGMEVFNQTDRYPFDRRRWDSILHELMPGRTVWGLANDDTHRAEHFGLNRNIFLLQELTAEAVFDATKEGRFYFFVPRERGTRPTVKLRGVDVTSDSVRLRLEGEFQQVDWITYNSVTEESEILKTGVEIHLQDIPDEATFVRAVILSEEGNTFLQPFGVMRAGL